MKLFHCSHCGSVVFFDSFLCVHCSSPLAFVPETLDVVALAPVDEDEDLWEVRRPSPDSAGASPAPQSAAGDGGNDAGGAPAVRYRLCGNRKAYNACNFTVACDTAGNTAAASTEGAAGDDGEPAAPLCVSCQQTRILPDLSDSNNQRRWTDIEQAKRRLYYSLAMLGLEHIEGETGPVFEFLADVPGEPPVLTGHANGVITLNVAEADDDERARRRLALGEPYRTLLGHLRHESGHYFWDVLVLRGGHLPAFREVFGDERLDYKEALEAHYARAPHTGWQDQFVSAYATAHPWEDWAETWAHYLHMIDLLETAESYRTELSVPGPHDAPRYTMVNPFATPVPDFDAMLTAWVPLTLLLNSLNRSLGQLDAYPFALSAGAQDKLRFVHALVHGQLVPSPLEEPEAAQEEPAVAPEGTAAPGVLPATPATPATVAEGPATLPTPPTGPTITAHP